MRRHHPRPPLLALAPRLWEDRRTGECAFPVAGDGEAVRSCCNPCPGETYCPGHRRLISAGQTESIERLVDHLRVLGLVE